ncbi:hypothetical protein ACXZ9C_10675 [Streptococcus agalactiae]
MSNIIISWSASASASSSSSSSLWLVSASWHSSQFRQVRRSSFVSVSVVV